MTRRNNIHADKLMVNAPVTGSRGTSGSANTSIESSGLSGTEDKSLLPHFGQSGEWSEKTENTVDLTPDVKFRKNK